jgi:Ran GTPase-activating protein (RanGAP) involved in mRNA processing and transport
MQLYNIVRVYAVMMKGGLSVTVEREELRRLVDELPENELNAARRYLEFIRDVGKDPVRFALENATLDDEPETDEERERAKRADEDFMAGRTTSMDELKRELGL